MNNKKQLDDFPFKMTAVPQTMGSMQWPCSNTAQDKKDTRSVRCYHTPSRSNPTLLLSILWQGKTKKVTAASYLPKKHPSKAPHSTWILALYVVLDPIIYRKYYAMVHHHKKSLSSKPQWIQQLLTHYIWVFLLKVKDPPAAGIDQFLSKHGKAIHVMITTNPKELIHQSKTFNTLCSNRLYQQNQYGNNPDPSRSNSLRTRHFFPRPLQQQSLLGPTQANSHNNLRCLMSH